MYAALFLAVLAGVLGLLPGRVNFWPTLFQALHLTNYYPYFGEGGFIRGTAVLWSLAVEEHFYLLFPMLCFVIMKRMSHRSRAMVLAVLCVFVLLWRYYLVAVLEVSTHRTYFCTDTRIDSILFGCIMGLFCNPVLDRKLEIGSGQAQGLMVLSGAILLFTFVYRDAVFRETVRYSL